MSQHQNYFNGGYHLGTARHPCLRAAGLAIYVYLYIYIGDFDHGSTDRRFAERVLLDYRTTCTAQ